jgi:hypothetical protein
VPCTWNSKVNIERYLRQHFPQRVVSINPRYAELRQGHPEFSATPDAMHPGLHSKPCRTHPESGVPENSRLVSAAPPPELVPEMLRIRIRKDESA